MDIIIEKEDCKYFPHTTVGCIGDFYVCLDGRLHFNSAMNYSEDVTNETIIDNIALDMYYYDNHCPSDINRIYIEESKGCIMIEANEGDNCGFYIELDTEDFIRRFKYNKRKKIIKNLYI